MHILLNHAYQYRPTNMRCTVIENFAERHRVNIRLDDGRVIQEVPYSDLLEPLAPPAPPAPPAPAPVVEAPATEEEATDTAPRRFRDRLRGDA